MLDDYQLFLFDFDGLLVDTERLHWKAYKELTARYGYELNETFMQYCEACHQKATGPRDYLHRLFPDLKQYKWEELYPQKCDIYSSLVKDTQLMPGAQELLEELAKQGKKRAVVTHSKLEHIELIRSQHPILETIPHWITREDYSEPKPSSECYQTAVDRLAEPGDRVVGFEDTPRGLNALKGTDAQPVIVCSPEYPLLPKVMDERTIHLTSLSKVL